MSDASPPRAAAMPASRETSKSRKSVRHADKHSNDESSRVVDELVEGAQQQAAHALERASKVRLLPPKSLYEFIISPSRWQTPDLKNSAKLGEQVKKNLLYFQTNYFLLSAAFFVLVFVLSMRTLTAGLVSGLVVSLAALFFLDYLPHAHSIKQKYPTTVVLAGCVLAFILWHALSAMLAVAGIALCLVPVWLAHALFRNADGLLEHGMSGSYFADTPMARLLTLMGVSARV